MMMTGLAALISAASLAAVFFGGIITPGTVLAEFAQIMLAGSTVIAVAGAAALDG